MNAIDPGFTKSLEPDGLTPEERKARVGRADQASVAIDEQPLLVILRGINGAGKSTLARGRFRCSTRTFFPPLPKSCARSHERHAHRR